MSRHKDYYQAIFSLKEQPMTRTDVAMLASTTETREAHLALCHDLQALGIWLYLDKQEQLIAGPPKLVQKHPAVVPRIKAHKDLLRALMEDSLAQEIFGEHSDDARFASDVCPECQQRFRILASPRRLMDHRTPDGLQVCPGSERAQQACVETIMQAFCEDCCVQRRMSMLTWISLRGALQAWCHRRGWFLPPRPYIIQWMDTQYTRVQEDDVSPVWAGLAITAQEWLGE